MRYEQLLETESSAELKKQWSPYSDPLLWFYGADTEEFTLHGNSSQGSHYTDRDSNPASYE